jgi:hypothetical protein
MKHATELGAALDAAAGVLSDLDVVALLLVADFGHGLQIALSDETDSATVRAALRGAATALEGEHLPLIGELNALLRARGWQHEDGLRTGGWTHPRLKDTKIRQPCDITTALAAQTYFEMEPPRVDAVDIEDIGRA